MAHAALVRGTRGYLAARWFGAPVLLLETIGRRSGRPYAAPLVYLADGDDLVVVPANAGADQTPAWWLNLRAAGEGVAIVEGLRRPVTPTVIEGSRRDRLWRRFGAVSPVEHYQRQTTRRLPVVALTPQPARAFRCTSSTHYVMAHEKASA
ncbi:MAG: nitroreductase family deazaflavin-dependent oxidoreductase [Thermoleophilaceae bacterium]|nr:nitroreductase family deazaflavin-dependent oxidoreductase [Thermoleophilaceae bacterium]